MRGQITRAKMSWMSGAWASALAASTALAIVFNWPVAERPRVPVDWAMDAESKLLQRKYEEAERIFLKGFNLHRRPYPCGAAHYIAMQAVGGCGWVHAKHQGEMHVYRRAMRRWLPRAIASAPYPEDKEKALQETRSYCREECNNDTVLAFEVYGVW